MGDPISKAQNGNKRDDGLTATGLPPSHHERGCLHCNIHWNSAAFEIESKN